MGNCVNSGKRQPKLGPQAVSTTRILSAQPPLLTIHIQVRQFLIDPLMPFTLIVQGNVNSYTGPTVSSSRLTQEIQSFYCGGPQQSTRRNMNKIISCVMESSPLDWNTEIELIAREGDGDQQKSLRLSQLFKWCCTSIFVCLTRPEKYELFTQEFTLKHALKEFLQSEFKISDTFAFSKQEIQPLKPGLLLHYSAEQLSRGVWIKNIFLRMIPQAQLIQFMQVRRRSQHLDLRTVLKFKGDCYIFSPTEKQQQDSTQVESEAIALVMPANKSQPLRFNTQIPEDLHSLCPDNKQWRSCGAVTCGPLRLLCVSTDQSKTNQRANKVLSLFGNQKVGGDSIFLVKKRKLAYPDIPKLESLTSVFTYQELKRSIGQHNGVSFWILRNAKNLPAKLYRLLLALTLVQTLMLMPQQLDQTILDLFNYKASAVKQGIYFLLTIQAIFIGSQLLSLCPDILNCPHHFPLEFIQCLYGQLGIYLDETILKIKQDSSFLTYQPQLSQSNIRHNLVILSAINARTVIYQQMIRHPGESMRFQNRQIKIKLPRGITCLPQLKILEDWCQRVTNINFRAVNGEECFRLEPLLVKFAIEVLLNVESKELTSKKIQAVLATLVVCSGEILATFYSLTAMSMEVKNYSFSEQMYLRALGIIHRIDADPRSRNNIPSIWETFILARLINMKRIMRNDVEIEWLQAMMDCQIGFQVVTSEPNTTREYPFPTGRTTDKTYEVHEMMSWIMQNLPIMHPSGVSFKREQFSKADINKSVTSTDSRSSVSRREKHVYDHLEKNEATISKAKYQGVFMLGNSRCSVHIHPPLKNLLVTKVACGLSHTIVSTRDSIYGWGENSSQQLGQIPGSSLRKIHQMSSSATKLSCGSQTSAAILDGRLKMWGQKAGGLVSGDGHLFDDVECGGLHSIGVRGGEVFSWGRGEGGQLGIRIQYLEVKKGNESFEYFLSHPKKIGGLERIKKVACGDAHTIVLDEQGVVWVFGFSYQGQLGLGLTGESLKYQVFQPVKLDFFKNTRIIDISTGSTFSTFITQSHEVFACGLNDYHQLGLEQPIRVRSFPSATNRSHRQSGLLSYSTPNQIDYFNQFQIQSITCGQNHSIAKGTYSGQQLYVGWGMNKSNQLGIPSSLSTAPTTIPGLQRLNVSGIGCGSTTTILLNGRGDQDQDESVQSKCLAVMRQLDTWHPKVG